MNQTVAHVHDGRVKRTTAKVVHHPEHAVAFALEPVGQCRRCRFLDEGTELYAGRQYLLAGALLSVTAKRLQNLTRQFLRLHLATAGVKTIDLVSAHGKLEFAVGIEGISFNSLSRPLAHMHSALPIDPHG